MRKYQKSLELIERALQTKSIDETHLKILQAGCWTHLGMNQSEAVRQLSEVIAMDPTNSFAFYGIGLNFYLNGELEKSLDPFTRALELNESSMIRAVKYKENAMKVLKLLSDGE